MEKINARIEETNGKYFISIADEFEDILIPISDDRPNEVKSAFNKLIAKLKEGEFEIELQDIGTDLASQVATEYIKQLNQELCEIHSEMARHKLV